MITRNTPAFAGARRHRANGVIQGDLAMNRRHLVLGSCAALLALSCGHRHVSGSPSTEARRDCSGVRPPGNTGKGLFTDRNTIYDANGCPFIPMGFNALVFWQADPPAQLASIDAMASQGANTVRIVTQSAGQFGWNANPGTQRELIARLDARGLVSVLEMHDATCDRSVSGVFEYWRSDAMRQLARDYERSLWINLANEHDFASQRAWRDSYLAEIRALRGLGVKNTVVLDMGKACGQDPRGVERYGRDLVDGDPQHNVVFSIHMYDHWRSLPCTGCAPATDGSQFDPIGDLERVANAGLPIMIGEFGWDTPASEDVPYDAHALVATAARQALGWTFWAWFDRREVPHLGIVTDLAKPTELTPAGRFIVPYLREHARKATHLSTPTQAPVVR
jgi:mannan endo-1,4-beta-mannosidase